MFSYDPNSQVLMGLQPITKSFDKKVSSKISSHTLRAYFDQDEDSYGALAQVCSNKSALSYMNFLGSNDSPADF